MPLADVITTEHLGPPQEKGPVRIAVIGTGWIAEHVYLPCLLHHRGIELAAAHDPAPEVLTCFADRAGLGPGRLGPKACWASDIEGVVLCTPPGVHAQQIAQAVALNKYVLCEKPVFRSLAELENLQTAGAASRLMGSAAMRLRKDVRLLLQWIQDGALGPLEHVRLCWWRERGVPAPGTWRTDPRFSPMGVMEDLGPHLLDLLASLISSHLWKELRVTAAVLRCRHGQDGRRGASWFVSGPRSPSYTVPDQASASLVSDTGTKVEIEVCWANEVPGDFCFLWFQGPKGTASFQGLLGLSTRRRTAQQQCSLELSGRPAEIHDFPLGAETQMQAFASSVDRFAQFARNLGPAAADFLEIRWVTEWLTHIQKASGVFVPEDPAEAVS